MKKTHIVVKGSSGTELLTPLNAVVLSAYSGGSYGVHANGMFDSVTKEEYDRIKKLIVEKGEVIDEK